MVNDSSLLTDIAQAVLARVDDARWTRNEGGVWCYLEPAGAVLRPQGWKLHVSATVLSAPVVLARAAEVLVREKCAFKFARDLDTLTRLLSNLHQRGAGGKFITAYP